MEYTSAASDRIISQKQNESSVVCFQTKDVTMLTPYWQNTTAIAKTTNLIDQEYFVIGQPSLFGSRGLHGRHDKRSICYMFIIIRKLFHKEIHISFFNHFLVFSSVYI